jgi:hypothetical protein
MNTIKDHWIDYRAQVIPSTASPVQLNECQLAFYGGAVSVLSIVVNLGDPTVTEEEAEATMDRLMQEVQAFRDSFERSGS